jgi:hypothetical protein
MSRSRQWRGTTAATASVQFNFYFTSATLCMPESEFLSTPIRFATNQNQHNEFERWQSKITPL